MKKQALLFYSLLGGALLLISAQMPSASGPSPKMAIVSFKACVEGSKVGKQEQAKFKEMEKQLKATFDAREKEVSSMAEKLKPAFIDALTPEKENELRESYELATRELNEMQGQYYAMLQDTNFQLVQELNKHVSLASKEVAKAKGFDVVFNDEACFFCSSTLDVSQLVIAELDTQFDKKEKELVKK